ncbi:hypothetical protein KGF56_003294 [Candida oxycetoniae]|uniref:Uncharacterized protein n=1 Tax=Candida oxycetoniae TaxID=497107 RepID=A0AAI9WXC7_9ASCO|nr:uncharacterized protein KGF56_003294 [Candida oxycetoniae]KAI3403864.2 hypothetical protein KGF56_003294 [Candida oxycetoniae]
MGRHSIKREKLANTSTRTQPLETSRFSPTKYETSAATLKNFPSSIVNGITREGGLYSLTLKSINCATYVEQDSNMRRVFKKPKLELPKISTVDLKTMRNKLQSDVKDEVEKVKNYDKIASKNVELTNLNKTLDLFSKNDDNGLEDVDKEVANVVGSDVDIILVSNGYRINTRVKFPQLVVETYQSVANVDSNANDDMTAAIDLANNTLKMLENENLSQTINSDESNLSRNSNNSEIVPSENAKSSTEEVKVSPEETKTEVNSGLVSSTSIPESQKPIVPEQTEL